MTTTSNESTNSTLGEKRSQIFRESTSSQTVTIPARLDSEDGRYIILWDDILLIFPNALRILNGEDIVLFLVDKSFKYLEPKRISHQPGVVLDVVIKTDTPTLNIPIISTTPLSPLLETEDFDFNIPNPHHIDHDEPLVPIPSSKYDQSTFNYSSSPVSSSLISTSNSPFYPDRRLSVTTRPPTSEYDYYAQSIIVGQEFQTSVLKEAIDRRFNDLQVELKKNHSLQLQVYNNQLQMESNQKEMLHIQKQTLDRLERIHDQIQSVMVNNYELHEDPAPRLFIILPKSNQKLSQQENVDPQFRLYFLCECGRHTTTPDTVGYHTVHIAKHQGYDLERPTEFFAKYSNHIMALLQMVKYGYSSREMTVPAIDEFEKTGSTDVIEGITKIPFSELVDSTIEYLQNKMKENSEQSDSANHGALDSADLRQLKSYLKQDPDDNRSLGHLYRMVSPDGFVKWICADHYREKYRHSATQKFKDFITVCEGVFMEEEGKAIVSINQLQSKGFYEVLEQVRGVQDLKLTLSWDVSLDDLRKLGTAVTRANITHFTLNGGAFKGPARDIINRNRRYDPIMQIMGNGRIQLLQVEHIQNFFVHVTSSSIKYSPNIRVLHIDSTLKVSDKSFRTHLMGILNNGPALTELHLKLTKPSQFLELVNDRFHKFLKLESINLESGRTNDREIVLKYSRLSPRSKSYPPVNNSTNDMIANDPQRKTSGALTVRINSEGWWNNLSKQSVTFHRFGNFITKITINGILNDSVVQGWSESVAKNEPKLQHLQLDTEHLSVESIKLILQLLGKSKSLETLELIFYESHVKERRAILDSILTNHKNVLKKLTLYGNSDERWIDEIARIIPHGLPKLELLYIDYAGTVSPSSFEWIVSLASNPAQEDPTRSPKPAPLSALNSASSSGNLKGLMLSGIKLQPVEWKKLIAAINLSKLTNLGIPKSNFSNSDLEILIEKMKRSQPLALKGLNIHGTPIMFTKLNVRQQGFLKEFDKSSDRHLIASFKLR